MREVDASTIGFPGRMLLICQLMEEVDGEAFSESPIHRPVASRMHSWDAGHP